MKLFLDDKTTHGYDLNANEACIFAAILKWTRSGKGWYGNYRELAAAMPFVMSYKTANRAVQKLLTLGLIESREEKLFACGQIVPTDGQIVPTDGQNVPENGQNVLPPNNPPINNYNNMKEKEEEQPRAQCTHDGAKQPEDLFEIFWSLYEVAPEFQNRRNATKAAFGARTTVAQMEMINSLKLHPEMKGSPNPYFFVVDFPDPQPVFLRGDEDGDIVQVKYNGMFKLCTRETMQRFNLEWSRDW